MSKKIKDTEYLFISTYLHAHEGRLVSRERLERMIDAPTAADAMKLLEDCGYGDMTGVGLSELEGRLAARREEAMKDLASLSPAPELVDVFRVKYDYHNAKAIVKAEAAGTDASSILSGAGRFAPETLKDAFLGVGGGNLPRTLADAMAEAKEALAKTGDPQIADFILDRAYFSEMEEFAGDVNSDYLSGYVRLSVDAANLRGAVRTVRMGRNAAFLKQALIDGGDVKPAAITAAVDGGDPMAQIFTGPLHGAAVLGDEAVSGKSLTAFERACDNAVVAYMAAARSVPFGEKVPLGYIFAVESEIAAVRTVVTGRLAGLSGDLIRERLRDLYV